MNGHKVTHNGMIGMLEAKEVDIALSDLSLTYNRGQVRFSLYKNKRKSLCLSVCPE